MMVMKVIYAFLMLLSLMASVSQPAEEENLRHTNLQDRIKRCRSGLQMQ